jgi:ssDNA-binding Zn-finger/Zn-ribbon topoisomerase 1
MDLPPEAWLLVAFLVVVALRSTRFKGSFGELRVRATAKLRLDGTRYRSLHNLTLPTPDGTTQIDHVVVSKFGIFVIETKNLSGWIFGDERSRKWTQSIYGNKYRFQNPLHQNYKHLKAVEDLLGLGPRCLHSVVVFVGSSRFKTPMPPNVLSRRELVPYIRSKTDVLLSDSQVEDSLRALRRSGASNVITGRRHVRNLRENRTNPTCPRCGQAMVPRTAARGSNAGGQFWGCAGYPQCRATKDVTFYVP